MKKIFVLTALAVMVAACNNPKKEEMPVVHDTVEIADILKKDYPDAISAVYDAHGGMNRWNQMNNLCFEMEGRSGKEVHTTSLQDRQSKIETANWAIGRDANQVWLLQNSEENAYKGNARFYHNLMFYFYAMPFIVGDDGINYSEVAPTDLAGTTYPGVKISYDAGTGDSADDEYVIYYNQETYQMEWLAYTVTFGKDAKSEDWHYIKYGEWQDVNGLQLPKTLTWYTVEDGKPMEVRNSMNFDKVTATETVIEAAVFAMPEGATVVEKE